MMSCGKAPLRGDMKPSPDKSQPRDSFKGSNPNTKHEDQETRVRTRHETMDWFKIGKGACQGCILPLCLFDLYAQCIMQNAGLDEVQAGIKMLGEISITSDMQMTPPIWQKAKRN